MYIQKEVEDESSIDELIRQTKALKKMHLDQQQLIIKMQDRIDNLELDIRAKESAQKTLAVAQSAYEIENLKTTLNEETVSIRKQVSDLDNALKDKFLQLTKMVADVEYLSNVPQQRGNSEAPDTHERMTKV